MKTQWTAILCLAWLLGEAGAKEPMPSDPTPLGLPDGAICRLAPSNLRQREGQGPIAFSRDGTRLASSHYWDGIHTASHECDAWKPIRAGFVRFWEIPSGKQLSHEIKTKGQAVHSLAFSPDGKLLAVAWCEAVAVYDASTGERRHFWHDSAKPRTTAISFSSDGKRLVAIDTVSALRIWSLPTGKALPPARVGDDSPNAYSFPQAVSGDGRYAATVLRDIHVWDTDSGNEAAKFARPAVARIWGLHFSPNGAFLAAEAEHAIYTWDVRDRKQLPSLKDPKHSNWGLAFLGEKSMLISSSLEGDVVLWDIRSGKQLARLHVGNHIKHVAVSLDKNVIATAAFDATVLLWNLKQLTGTTRSDRRSKVGRASRAGRAGFRRCRPASTGFDRVGWWQGR